MPNPKRKRKMITKNNGRKATYSSLSEIEDRNDLAFWNTVTREAALKAINENKALNIPVTILENEWIVRKSSDGTIQRIKKIEKRVATNQSYTLSKGSVLHVKSN